MCIVFFFFFFFKQKTAYEIGTGDWSSDVCSSDLLQNYDLFFLNERIDIGFFLSVEDFPDKKQLVFLTDNLRSEERRVGKECRSRWSPYH